VTYITNNIQIPEKVKNGVNNVRRLVQTLEKSGWDRYKNAWTDGTHVYHSSYAKAKPVGILVKKIELNMPIDLAYSSFSKDSAEKDMLAIINAISSPLQETLKTISELSRKYHIAHVKNDNEHYVLAFELLGKKEAARLPEKTRA